MSYGSMVANLFARSYLHNLMKELDRVSFPDSKAAIARIRFDGKKMFNDRPKTTPDSLAPLFFGSVTALVLATYRNVFAQTGDSKLAFEVARNSGWSVFGVPTRTATRICLWFLKDPIRSLSGKSMLKYLWMLRKWSLVFSEKITEDRATLFVHQCPYHKFFSMHGEPQLGVILCEWDRLWMDVLDESSRPIRTERITTISTGSKQCEFRLIRDVSKAIKETRDVAMGWKPVE